MDIKSTIHAIAVSVAEATEPDRPDVALVNVSPESIQAEIDRMGLRTIEGLLDATYYCPSREDLMKMVAYVYLEFRWPKYLSDRMDCDKFAFLMRGLAAAFFGCNTFACTRGNLGGHYWILVRCSDGEWVQLEPQNGMMMEMDNPSYIPMTVEV
jgi:hypothetical protein